MAENETGKTEEMLDAGQAPTAFTPQGGDLAKYIEMGDRALDIADKRVAAIEDQNKLLLGTNEKLEGRLKEAEDEIKVLTKVRTRFENLWESQASVGMDGRHWHGGSDLETKVIEGVGEQIMRAYQDSASEARGGKMSKNIDLCVNTRAAEYDGLTDAKGAGTVPTLTDTEIHRFMRGRSLARLLCRPFPIQTKQANINSLPTAVTAYHVAAAAAPSSRSDEAIVKTAVTVATITAVITMSEELEQDSVANWMNFWGEASLDAFAFREMASVFSETASDSNAAFTGALQAVQDAAGANDVALATHIDALSYDDLVNVQNGVAAIAQSGAVWVVSQSVFAKIQQVKDSQGYPLIGPAAMGMPHPTPQPDPTLPQPTVLLGHNLYVTENMRASATTSGLGVILYGNFRKGHVFGVRSDMETAVSKEAVFEQGGSMVRSRERYVTANILTADGFAVGKNA